jgi:hypothetical protein
MGTFITKPGPALKSTIGPTPIGNFEDVRFSPSELIGRDELFGSLRQEGFTDGIGLGEGLAPCAVHEVERAELAIETPDDPRGRRVVTDGRWEATFINFCGTGQVFTSDRRSKRSGGFLVEGHAHTTGVMAPKRGIVCATCAEVKRLKSDDPPSSEVVVYDYKAEKELGRLRMPITSFTTIAVSRDEKWLYVGFGDETIRRFSLDVLFPPKKKGWF